MALKPILTLFAGIALLSMPAGAAERSVSKRDLAPFSSVAIDGFLEVVIRVGEPQSVTITADRDQAEKVQTLVKDGMLSIDTKTRWYKNQDVNVVITVPNLSALRIDGAADASVTGLKGDSFTLKLDGAGDIRLAGAVAKADLTLDGAGDIDARKLKTEDVKVQIDGAGAVKAWATASAALFLDGVGSIDLWGNPAKVTKDRDGIGSIDIRPGNPE